MTLPPLPHHPEPHTYKWTKLELEAIEAYGRTCYRKAVEEAAKVCETQIDPTRSAATSGYAYWHAKAIKELLK